MRCSQILSCWLILVGSVWAQATNPEPYPVGDELRGEFLKAFVTYNSRCDLAFDPPSLIVPGQKETEIRCSVDTENTAWQTIEETIKHPDFLWKHVPFRILWAVVGEKHGLTMSLAFPRSDYSTLRSQFEMELGKPDQDSGVREETVVWENGISRLELRREAGSLDNTSVAVVYQTKDIERVVVYVMEKKIEANNKLSQTQGK